jgi:hypothetical protein
MDIPCIVITKYMYRDRSEGLIWIRKFRFLVDENYVDVRVHLIDDHVPAAGAADGIGAGLLPFSLHGSQISNKNNNNAYGRGGVGCGGAPNSDEGTDTVVL